MCNDSTDIINKIEWIFNASEQELTEFFHKIDEKELKKIFLELKKRRAYTWKDRMLLQMIDKTPNLTFWASDRNYTVRLWEGQCNSIYGKNYEGYPFYDFISPLERIDAMKDSMLIINSKESEVGVHIKSFENYYTMDTAGEYAPVEMITNSVQLIDNDNGDIYYGEVGLHLNLNEVKKRYTEQQSKLEKKQKLIEKEWDKLLYEFQQRKNALIDDVEKLKLNRKTLREFNNKINEIQNKLVEEVDAQRTKWVDTYQEDIQKIREIIGQKYDEIDDALESKDIAEKQIDKIKVQSDITKEKLRGRINSAKYVINTNFTKRINSLKIDDANPTVAEKLRKRQDKLLSKKRSFISDLSTMLVAIEQLVENGILLESQYAIIDGIERTAEEYLESEASQYDE